jgi:anti-anti-sigma regulatory factor
MRLHVEGADRGTQLIRVIGDLEGEDALTLARVPEETDDPPPRRRVIDLTEITFMDWALLDVATATTDAGGGIILVIRGDSYVRRLLEIRGVIHRFRVYATREEALAG